ncbi:MAG: site-2 protease family protein [Chloroflexota bacterium]|nr:site-2 protease family protein [Chloroflexota bacterium]MDE2931404.1 site-2 protease family protein [Chloroflexota bacterium]
MNQGALTLFRLAGITVRLHYTWFLAFFLIAWSLPRLIYPFGYPGWSELHYWIAGSAAAVLLFGSVLFHEFAHSFMALARGLKVDGITLFVFGGAAVLKSEPRRPSDEFLIAVVGPASSLLLAIVFLLLSALIPRDVPAQPLILQLAFINSGLAIFNLMPGFPLDGGRVFRAIVWYITGSMRKGTTIATIVGQVFAFGLIALGIFFILRGSFVIGIWTIFIGWFLNGAAGANRRQAKQEEALQGVKAASLMHANPAVVAPDETIDRVVLAMLLRDGIRALPVVQDGQVLGMLSTEEINHVPQHAWPWRTVFDTMASSPPITVAPDDPLPHVMDLFEEHAARHVLVMDGADVVGVLSREDIARFLALSRELRVEAARSQEETVGEPTDRTSG